MMAVIGGMTPRIYTSQVYQNNQLQAEQRTGAVSESQSTDVTSFSQVALELAARDNENKSTADDSPASATPEIVSTPPVNSLPLQVASVEEIEENNQIESRQTEGDANAASTPAVPPPEYKGINFMA
jgi:hypothetical protein